MIRPMDPRSIALDGIDATVVIDRDRFGIPHVRASSLRDLFFGQGFATAADRGWHLEWDLRRAAGTLAAVTGQPAHVISDAFARRARLLDVAQRGYDQLSDDERLPLDAQAAGINAYLELGTIPPPELVQLGIEASRWRGADAVAVFQIRHVLFATWQTKLWRARVVASLGPEAVARFNREGSWGDTPVIVPAGVRTAVGELEAAGLLREDPAVTQALAEMAPLGLALSGSNCWVVGGSRTAHGKPLLAGDPHRAFEVPNVYYQLRLSCPEADIDAAGFSFPGVPGVQHFGQNAHLAWGVTNAMADYQDLYVERLDNPAVERREETIEVAGGPATTVECLLTRHGPIVVGGTEQGVGLALASTGMVDPAGSLRLLLPLLRARSVAELDGALSQWVEPLNNWVLADGAGSIGYRTAGKVPIRPTINSWLPVPGWDTAYDWSGLIPDAELPRQRNPDVDTIVTANQRITTRDYPHLLGSDCYGASRAQRIWDRLGQRTGLTGEDMAAIHGDTISTAGLHFAALSGHPWLAGWDGAMDRDSAAAALYAVARDRLVRRISAGLDPALLTNPFAAWEPAATALPATQRVDNALDGWLAANDVTMLSSEATWAAAAAQALEEATTELSARFGADPGGWSWGGLHELTPLHALRQLMGDWVRPTSGPISGASGCVMATNQTGGMGPQALSGSTARYLWDLADRQGSGWVVPLGASGDPTSAHFRDQSAAYAAVELVSVFAVAASSQRLEPVTGTARTPFTAPLP